MKAIDTNVLARFFVDDPDDEQSVAQRPAAVAAMSGRVWVGITVVIEFEWVMRGFYKLLREDVVKVLTALCSQESVTVEDRDVVLAAVDAHAHGMDFADALHVSRASSCSAFISFDKSLTRRATKLRLAPETELLG